MSIVFAPGFRGGKRFHDTISYRSTYSSGGSQSSATYTNCDIGTAASNRTVVVFAFTFDGSGGSHAISSVTIGGTAASPVAGTSVSEPYNTCGFYQLAVASGTTATIVVNIAGGPVASGIGVAVWATYGVQSWTPIGVNTGSVSSGTSVAAGSIATGPGGVAIGGIATLGASGFTPTFTGITQNYNTTFPNNNFPGLGGSAVTAGSSAALSATWTGNSFAVASLFSVG